MVNKLILLLIIVGIMGGGWYVYENNYSLYSPLAKKITKNELPLTKYDFDELKKRGGKAGRIEFLGAIKEIEERRESCRGKTCQSKEDLAKFETKQFRYESSGKWITGMINVPIAADSKSKPLIIMVRGYADTAGYYSGSGSWRMADRLAAEGYVTVSTDFLGFGGSDWPSEDILEARFEKVPAVLDLIETVKTLDYVDSNRIGIWAHSNGGQIVLSVLEIMGVNYPTVLWAPMTNPFPQSVLDTIEDDEAGRIVRAKIEEFGKHYDYRRYAFENYYSWIKAPVLIHQGTGDEWCEVKWQENVVAGIRSAGGEASLDILAGDDHNLSVNWLEVVERDIGFYNSKL